jgi:F0F1-type ATP synthase assembly protein I
MDDKPRRPDLRRLAEMTSIGLILPSSIAIGLFFGYYLDRWLGTAPWLLLTFTVLGIASGLISLLRAIRKEFKDEPPAG